MSNTLSVITPIIHMLALNALRENAIMYSLINRRYEQTANDPGTPISIPVPKPATVYDVTPGVAITTSNVDPNEVQILPFANWKATALKLNDQEQGQILNGYLPSQLTQHARALANAIDKDILVTMYNGIGNTHGTANAPDDKSDILAVSRRLDETLCPESPRSFVVNPVTKSLFLQIDEIARYDATGDRNPAVVTGRMGTGYGFDFYMDQNLVSMTQHTMGTVGASATTAENQVDVNGALAVGAKSMVVDGAGLATGTITKGTKFQFAGSDKVYTVTADVTLAGSAGTVAFAPSLQETVANDVKVTFLTDYTVHGMAFHEDCAAIVVRPFPEIPGDLGHKIVQSRDPKSQLSLRTIMRYANHELFWEFDVQWGCAVVRPEYGCLLVEFTGNGTNTTAS